MSHIKEAVLAGSALSIAGGCMVSPTIPSSLTERSTPRSISDYPTSIPHPLDDEFTVSSRVIPLSDLQTLDERYHIDLPEKLPKGYSLDDDIKITPWSGAPLMTVVITGEEENILLQVQESTDFVDDGERSEQKLAGKPVFRSERANEEEGWRSFMYQWRQGRYRYALIGGDDEALEDTLRGMPYFQE